MSALKILLIVQIAKIAKNLNAQNVKMATRQMVKIFVKSLVTVKKKLELWQWMKKMVNVILVQKYYLDALNAIHTLNALNAIQRAISRSEKPMMGNSVFARRVII